MMFFCKVLFELICLAVYLLLVKASQRNILGWHQNDVTEAARKNKTKRILIIITTWAFSINQPPVAFFSLLYGRISSGQISKENDCYLFVAENYKLFSCNQSAVSFFSLLYGRISSGQISKENDCYLFVAVHSTLSSEN